MPSALLRIGPFARLARVTIKTLRFYDSAGLFHPVWIDPRSGYRFYSPTQLPRLRRIRMLRELGCSLAEIQQLIAASPGGEISHVHAAALRRRLTLSVAVAEQRLRQLEALTGAAIKERAIAATPALTIRDCVKAGGSDIHRMFESAERQAARLDVRAQESPFTLLHDTDYHRPQMDVEVCIPTCPEALGQAGVRVIEPVARAACLEFNGDYAQAPLLLDAALDNMHERRAQTAGPIREVYLRFGADQRGYTLDPRFLTDDPSRYRTELLIPISSG